MAITLRPTRALFRFSGPDAQKWLFDIVTARVLAETGPPVWWALLSPQGKVQAEGLCSFSDGAFWLDVEASVADSFFKRMRIYRLRSAVEIADLRATHRVGWDGTDVRGRAIGTVEEAAGWLPPSTDYDHARIAAGLAELGPDFAPDTVFPHDIGMDLRGGVDFTKGCYIGQEVVSRMQHRGTARRRPVIISGTSAPAGTPVLVNGRDSGTLGLCVDGKAIGIVRLDRFDGGDVTVDGAPVSVTVPDWAPYRLGESPVAE